MAKKIVRRASWPALAAVMMLWPIGAFAHAKLLSTAPADGARLEVAPNALTLKFNEAVRLAVLKVAKDGAQAPVPVALDRGAAAAPAVSVALPPLGSGTYRVEWSAITADDGHVVKGAFSFTIADHR